ncbi:MAG: GNAT family N-acetyltransferase [Candidatus Bathyarchaeia archaeon]|jgi:ribosomal protein S18 acetylase RimI-like enzyme
MVNVEFTIRPMIPSDASGLKGIIDLSFSPFLRFFALHSIREGGRVFVSQTQGGVAVGFVKLIEFQVGGGRFGCILWVAVHPQFRRRGIAAALVNAGVECVKHAGAGAVFASVQRRNVASLTVFGRQGFRRLSFLELWRLFGWRTFDFYRDIWLAPGEVVLMLNVVGELPTN